MRLTRRTLLGGVSSLALATMVPMAHGQNAVSRTVFVALKGIDRLTDRATIESLVDVFFSSQIPVSLILHDPNDPSSPTGSALEHSLSLLKNLFSARNLVEFILPHTPEETPHRYLHLRSATQLKAKIETILAQLDVDTSADSFVSIYDLSTDDVLEPYAYRSAGLRIQVRRDRALEDEGQTEVVAVDWGILKILGGIYSDITSDPKEALEVMTTSGPQQLVVIDVTTSLDQSPAWLIGQMRRWADQLNSEIAGGGLLVTRPKDFLLQGNPGASKSMALVIDVGQSGQMAPEIAEFSRLLDEINVPYSLVGTPQVGTPAAAPLSCSITTSTDSTAHRRDNICVRLTDPRSGIDDKNPATIIIHSANTQPGWIGPGADARFHVFLKAFQPGGLLNAIREAPLTDGVELISLADVKSKFQAIALARAVEHAHREGRINFVTLPDLRDVIMAPDEVVKRVWSVRRREANEQDIDGSTHPVIRAAFLKDAEIAWGFLERHTKDATGLCAGTVSRTGTAESVNNIITLWDIGSHIQGIIGALHLGLIDKLMARTSTNKIIENIPAFKNGDSRLPYALFNAETLQPVAENFDASDTGRFLIALQSAVSAGLVEEDDARMLMSTWKLDGAVVDGRIHSFSRGEWVDTFASHSTHYTRHGYAFAGIDLETPYPVLPGAPTGDHLIRLLHKVAEIGHYGAEPSLLEVVEDVQSSENQYLARVLFDAQLRYFETTGKIRCVSENPINVPPWFIYQGLRVDLAEEAEWVVTARNSRDPLSRSGDASLYRIISSKAAFLWAAAFPHPHSMRLISLVRNRGRIEGLGYASGLREDTQEPMEGYSDLNTNGIILSAIGKILS